MKGTQIIIGKDEHQKAFFSGLSFFIDIINKELSKKYPPEPLGNHIKVLGGYAFKSSEYKSQGIPVIRISDFQEEKIDLSNVQYYQESKECDKYELFEGEIIIALTGGTIGKLGIVQKGLGKLYLNQRVGKFSVLHPKEFYDRYVYWLARGVQEKVKGFGYGGAQPNISGSQIEQIEFSIPNKKEQEKIVEFLEDLKNNEIKDKEYFNKESEDRIKSLLKIIEGISTSQNLQINNISYISRLRQQILLEAVKGKLVKQDPKDESASELLKKIKAEKEKLIREGKIRKEKPLKPILEDEIPYELPKGWECVRLGEICERIHYGYTASAIHNSNGVRLLRITDIQNDKINWNKVPSCQISDSECNKYLINENDILIARTGGTIGKSYLVKNINVKAVFASYLIRAIPLKKINQDYIKIFLGSILYWDQLFQNSMGTGQPNVNGVALSNLKFSLPPLSEQKRIVEKVDKLMTYCDELEKQVKENQGNSEKLMGAVLRESFER